MAIDDAFFKEIVETFKAELDERLQSITSGLLELEKESSIDKKDEIIANIFRAAHNIKGSARGIGILDVGEIAHYVENLFTAIRKKTLIVNPEIINLCLQAVDGMKEAMECFAQKKSLSFDLTTLLNNLKNSILTQESPSVLEPPQSSPDTKISSDLKIPDSQPQPKEQDEGSQSEMSAKENEIKSQEENINKENLPEQEIVKKVKLTTKENEYETIRVALYNLDRVSAYMEEMQIKKIVLDEHFIDLEKLNHRAGQFLQSWKKTLLDTKNTIDIANWQVLNATVDKFTEITTFINRMYKNMTSHINELTVLSNSLQEEVRLLRLIPTSNLLQTLPRVVRDLSYKLQKQVTLEIKDKNTKIDKIVLEGIKDPIIHILRNAIDHGLESAEYRKNHGKNEMGTIQIDVQEEGNNVIFLIKDDGSGIDHDKIANLALKKGIISKSELSLLNKDEIINLIFLPGFSTKEIITDISGRGVGLDVVSANIANLKGEISVATEIGKGTTFILKVPLTLATDRGLIVECNNQLFVLATSFIERVILITQQDIVQIEQNPAVLIENKAILLRSLAEILELSDNLQVNQNQLPVVVIKKGKASIALLVNKIIGEREIVIKSLQDPLKNIPYVLGATLSGNGEIILVLNLSDVLSKAMVSNKIIVINKDLNQMVDTRKKLLVADDSITTRTFVKNILTSKGYNVVSVADGKEAWDLLQKEKFDLLITDVEMPNLDGFSLTELIKKNITLHDIPVIIVTSLENEEQRKRGLEVGANAYIVKNKFDSRSLVELVDKMA